jgi:hypothetical protein
MTVEALIERKRIHWKYGLIATVIGLPMTLLILAKMIPVATNGIILGGLSRALAPVWGLIPSVDLKNAVTAGNVVSLVFMLLFLAGAFLIAEARKCGDREKRLRSEVEDESIRRSMPR